MPINPEFCTYPMLKRIVFLLILISFAFHGFCAGFPKPTFKVSFSKTDVMAGDIVEIIIRFDVPKGFHIYSEKSDCPEDDGPMRASIDFTPHSSYELMGKFFGIGDHMVKETDVFNCSTGEFTTKGEFRQKIRVYTSIGNPGIQLLFNGQICNESGCDNIRNVSIKTPSINVIGTNKSRSLTETEPETQVDSFAKDTPIQTIQSNTQSSYRNGKQGQIKTFNGNAGAEKSGSYWGLFILAFLSGLTALLTPCVFPMIPMTVSFFIKNNKRSVAIRDSIVFSLSLIGLYTILGTLAAIAFGANAANWLSTHWLPNIFFTLIFLVFAASFFGAFDIVMPSWLVNKVDKKSDQGGISGAIFMAVTIALVSFSCTGPIVGTVLVEAVQGGTIRPIVAMFGFSLAFALPFGLLAMFPSWLNKLPKSGDWLTTVKVVLGFVELAFALKFLSIPDQTYHWGILDREVYLAIWIVIFSLMGLYLLGKIKFPHDSPVEHLSVGRLGFVLVTFTFVVYIIPGMWGAPLKGLAGYLPPIGSQDFNCAPENGGRLEGNIASTPSYTESLSVPQNLAGYLDYEEALAAARTLKKPLFIDFTGHGCVNCRKMEERVWSDPAILKLLKTEYVVASLYVDDKKIVLPPSEWFNAVRGQKITLLGDKNAYIEEQYFGKTTQPLYCIIDENENLLQPAFGADYFKFQSPPFKKFLEDGISEFKKNRP